MAKNVSSSRRVDIDVARGVLIICVVIGHIINFDYFVTGGIKTIIYSFHMPAFFVISGMLMNTDKIKSQSYSNLVKKRAKRLLVPYICFELVGGVLQMALMGIDVVNPLGIIYGIVTIHCHVGADWFLPTLFFVEIIFYISTKRFEKNFCIITGVSCMILAFVVPDFNYFIAIIRRIFIGYGYIVFGHIGKNVFYNKNRLGMALSGGALVVLAYFNGIVDLSERIFHNPVLYCITGLLGTYLVLNVADCINGFLQKGLIKIGEESLLIMGTHQHIMLIANCIVGSEYCLQVQLILIVAVLVYETLLISLKRCGLWNTIVHYRNKFIRQKGYLDMEQGGKGQDETKK